MPFRKMQISSPLPAFKEYAINLKMDLFVRLVIIISVIITLTDTILYYVMLKHGMLNDVTLQFVAMVIIVTIIPILINMWYWMVFRQKTKK